YATGARGRPAPRRPRLQPCALRGQGVALGRPVHQSRALLLDHGGRGVVDEAFAGQLGLRLRQLRLDALELLVQARAFGVEVDEAFEGYEQPKLADDAGGRGRRIAGQRLDALDAVEEPELRREARGARGILVADALQQEDYRLRRRHAQYAADPAQRRHHRVEPFDVGLGAGEVAGQVAGLRIALQHDRAALDAQPRRDLLPQLLGHE